MGPNVRQMNSRGEESLASISANQSKSALHGKQISDSRVSEPNHENGHGIGPSHGLGVVTAVLKPLCHSFPKVSKLGSRTSAQ